MPNKQLYWYFRLFLDVSHAGSCKDRAQEWQKNNDSYNYFDQKCFLNLKIHCSCKANELAYDTGSGKGGLWFNHFIAKGNTDFESMMDVVLKVTRLDEQGKPKEFSQTS